MRFLRYFVVAASLATSTLVALSSHAQSVQPAPVVEWLMRPDDGGSTNININQADCLSEAASVRFDVEVVSPGDLTFEVWAGSGCAETTARDNEKACIPLLSVDAQPSVDVRVPVRDLVQEAEEGAGAKQGTAEDCSGGTNNEKRTLFFMLVDSDRKAVGTVGQWPFTFDMKAPAAITSLTAGPGEDSLTLDFDASDDDDAKRYNYYCSRLDEETPAEEEETPEAAGGSGGVGNTDDGTGGTDSTPPTDPDCNSSVLKAGQARPKEGKYSCGDDGTTGTSSGITSSTLENGVRYAVAMTVEDEDGNESVLSNIACATPAEVTGYYEAYRDAGGQAGGGFCTYAPARRATIPMALALLALAAAFARRRR